MRSGLVVLLVLVGGCSRKAPEDSPRADPRLRPATIRDAGIVARDAIAARPPVIDAGAAAPATEEIKADRVIKQGWFDCHVYRKYVVLVNGPPFEQHVAVKLAGTDVAASCRWKGPFLHEVRTPYRLKPGHAPTMRVTFRGVFRDLLIFMATEDCGGYLVLYDLAARKERLKVGYTAESDLKYEGDGRFTWWDDEGLLREGEAEKLVPPLVEPKKEGDDLAYRDASDRQCTEALWRQLATIKLRHRPLFDGVKEKPCYDKWNYDVERSHDPDGGLVYTPGNLPDCSKFRWSARRRLDLRDPKVQLLPELKCSRSRMEEC